MSSDARGPGLQPGNAAPRTAPHHLLRRAWLPALLWLAVIAWESTPLASSEETGRFLRPLILFFDPQITQAQFALIHGALRKAGHFFGYGVLSLLMLRAWWATPELPRAATRLPSLLAMVRSWSGRAAALALAFTAAAASLDEWHQTSLAGRTGNFHDVILDSGAALCVQLLLIAFSDVRKAEERVPSETRSAASRDEYRPA